MNPFDEVGTLDYDPEDVIGVMEDMAHIRSIVPDGVSIEQLVVTYNAVHGPDFEGDGSHPHTDEFLTRLRSVKP